MTARKPARSQVLPESEREYLATLTATPQLLRRRVVRLFEAGWTLAAIGSALTPQRPRSTVHAWVLAPRVDSPTDDVTEMPIPRPTQSHAPARAKSVPRPVSPGISATDLAQIRTLAPLAKKYRARISPAASAAIANVQLTTLCRQLHAQGVTVTELAEAAEVTYRPMARRLGLPTKKRNPAE